MGGIARTVGQLGAFMVGNMLAGPLGGAVGNTLFGMLFPPPKPMTPGTRLSDLMREGAEIGTPIKEFYGIMSTKGDVIDCGVDKHGVPAGIEEVVKNVKQPGATGGGAPPEQKDYTYYLTAAFLLGEGPLWVDQIKYEDAKGTHVLYDRWKAGQPDPKSAEWRTLWNAIASGAQPYITGSGKKKLVLTPEYAPNGELIAELSQHLRIYPGTEWQRPDTALQAIHGDKTCPYRGDAYVMVSHFGPIEGSLNFSFMVRSATTGRRQIIRRRLLGCGVAPERIALNSISGDLHGAARTQLEAPREICEKIAASQYHDLLFINGGFHDASRLNPATWQLGPGKLGAHVVSGRGDSEPPSRTDIKLKPVRDRPSSITIRFLDPNLNYEQNEVVAQRNSAEHENPMTIELPFAANPSEMLPLADITLDELWASDGAEEVALLPESIQIAPGNVLIYPDDTGLRRIRIVKQGLGTRGPLEMTGAPYDPGVYGIHRLIDNPIVPRLRVPEYAIPVVYLGDLPCFSDIRRTQPGIVFAATTPDASNWSGAQLLSDDSTGFGNASTDARATLGELLTAYSYTDTDLNRVRYDQTIRVRLLGHGGLASCAQSDLQRRANLLALGDLIVSYVQATPVPGLPDVYDLTGLWPGRYGTDWLQSVAVGTRVLKLTDEAGSLDGAITFVPVSLSKLRLGRALEVTAIDDPTATTGTLTYNLGGNNLRPPRVLDLWKSSDGLGGLVVSCFPRTRDWDSAEAFWAHGAGARETDPRRVTIALRNGASVVDTRTVDSATLPVVVSYSQAELTSWFGSVPTTLSGSVWHEGAFLRGQENVFTI